MALTSYGKSFKMTAANDERTDILHLTSLVLSGTTMTPGQQLVVTDSAGDLIATHYVESANENKEFFIRPRFCKGVKLVTAPAAGTWTLLGQFD